MKLSDRQWNLTVSTEGGNALDVSALDISFKVKKKLKPVPNNAEIRIFNLNKESRRKIEEAERPTIRLEAGYLEGMCQLYLGQIRSGFSVVEGPDIITHLWTGDSEKEVARARIASPIGPGAPVDQVLFTIAKKLGIGLGNIDFAAKTLRDKGILSLHPHGGAIVGNVARELTDFCRSAGLEWCIDDGKLVFTALNGALGSPNDAVVLRSGTGLIGSPSLNNNNKGEVDAVCLIQPNLRPGHLVVFDTFSVTGGYRIEEVTYEGESYGTPWFAKLKCRKI